ncbi:hypothetical protein [Sphaerisporangium dianthi]|uniref:RHS repeat protein n=1 Tax=Sphaerisporangium dianthi TaxID=1436120 RepID=A0ABV9CGM6_9ACTN
MSVDEAYDAAGANTRTTDGRGNAFLTTYNTLGRVESRIEPSTQAHPGSADRTWTMSYDAAGNQVDVQQPGGVRITNTYDNLGRLVTEAGSGAEAATQSNTFGYALAGRRTSANDLNFTFNDRGLLLKTAKNGDIGRPVVVRLRRQRPARPAHRRLRLSDVHL